MNKLFIALKILINIVLFGFYSLVFVIAWNFAFGLILSILNRSVPWSEDPIHAKMAVLVIFLTLLITLLFRKVFYLSIFPKINFTDIKKIKNIKSEPKDEELEIYINKEIK